MTPKCKKHPDSGFYFPPTRPQGECKKCTHDRVVKFRRDQKELLVRLFGGKCRCCGYSRYFRSLQFHHLDPSQKSFGIAGGGDCRTTEDLYEEAKKCVLVCANCHGEIEGGMTPAPEYREPLPLPVKASAEPKKCADCDFKLGPGAKKYCIDCFQQHRDQFNWPSDEELSKLVFATPLYKLGKVMGVSDAAIKARCLKRGILMPRMHKRASCEI